MILNQNQQSDAQLIGDIQNNKVGIDTNNLDFITSLLTTNLYSQPIQSFIRETVANGWDSHVEAGTTDKPVIIRIFTNDKYEIQLAVRDYGTGLSPERFNEIYLNIGASTKRSSNQYIGAFGLGRWSMLAVSDVCYLTNYYNGTCSKYIAYKDNGKICVDKVFESTTTEENGLEVEVNTETRANNSYELRKKIALGIKQLTFYHNVYVYDPEGFADIGDYPSMKKFNSRKIEDFKTFKICSCGNVKNSLLMGNVLYPIDSAIINKWFQGLDKVPFAIKCNIGEVDITPSRETLLYSQKTLDTINKKCQEALEEIKEICKNNFGSDFSTISTYYNFISNDAVEIALKQFDDCTVCLHIPTKDLSYYDLSSKVTINGQVPPDNLLDYWKKVSYMNLSSRFVLYDYCSGRFHVKDNRLSVRKFFEYVDIKKVYLIDEPLKPIAKKYWIQELNYDEWRSYYFLYKKYAYSTFRKIIKEFCNTYKVTPTDKTLKFILDDVKRNYVNLPSYNNTDVPQEYINAFKAERKKIQITAQQKARKCVIYKLTQGRKYQSIGYDSSETSEELKSYKGTVFFAEKGNPYLEMFYYIINEISKLNNKILLVEVAPSNLPILRELKNTIEFNTVFTEKNNIISKICTYLYLAEKWFNEDMSYSYYTNNFLGVNKIYNIIYDIKRTRSALTRCNVDNELLKLLCKTYFKNGWLNYTIINTVETNIDVIKFDSVFAKSGDSRLKDIIIAFYKYVTKNNINQENLKIIKETLKPILDEYTPNTELSHFDIG